MRPYFLVFLLIPLMQALAQSYPSPTNVRQYPIANQFEHLSIKDGLPNNSINSILQDRDGYMWFGTHEGLTKYDGVTFTIFQPNPQQPAHSFQNSIITSLCEGNTNQMWAVTEGGGLHEINTRPGLSRHTPLRLQKPINGITRLPFIKIARTFFGSGRLLDWPAMIPHDITSGCILRLKLKCH